MRISTNEDAVETKLSCSQFDNTVLNSSSLKSAFRLLGLFVSGERC